MTQYDPDRELKNADQHFWHLQCAMFVLEQSFSVKCVPFRYET